ncbi:MAG: alternative oxidase [Minisyncoccia bacterium]
MTSKEHEALLKELQNGDQLKAYKEKYDNLPCGFLPRFFAKILFGTIDIMYGSEPSLQKFKVLEVVARVPYQTWEFVSYLATTNFYNNEKRAIDYACIADFGKFAQDNETMHVVVISHICKQEKVGNWFAHTFIPIIMAYIYMIISTVLYLLDRKHSYELNYMFEDHAYSQYTIFLEKNKESLKSKPIHSEFLNYYGRVCDNQYDFFESVKNDEIIHRNESAVEMVKDNGNMMTDFIDDTFDLDKN